MSEIMISPYFIMGHFIIIMIMPNTWQRRGRAFAHYYLRIEPSMLAEYIISFDDDKAHQFHRAASLLPLPANIDNASFALRQRAHLHHLRGPPARALLEIFVPMMLSIEARLTFPRRRHLYIPHAQTASAIPAREIGVKLPL